MVAIVMVVVMMMTEADVGGDGDVDDDDGRWQIRSKLLQMVIQREYVQSVIRLATTRNAAI